MNIEVVYRCPICKQLFENPGDAVACLLAHPPVTSPTSQPCNEKKPKGALFLKNTIDRFLRKCDT